MSKKDREKKKIKENKKKIAFMDRKASFFSALLVLVTMLNECLEYKYDGKEFLNWIYVLEIVASIVLYFIILCTKKLDKQIDTEKAEKLTAFLTFVSIIVFILCLAIKMDPKPWEIWMGFVLFSVETVGGIIYLIFG